MKRLLTVLLVVFSFGAFAPGDASADYYSWQERIERWREWRDWYRSRGVAEEQGDDVQRIESAAQQIGTSIAAESGGSTEQYIEYARKLALTLNQKSGEELGRIITKGSLSIGG